MQLLGDYTGDLKPWQSVVRKSVIQGKAGEVTYRMFFGANCPRLKGELFHNY
jgi:hypothetical protein